MLKQVSPINEQWAAIIDHSIDIGTKKALVVLRVSLDTLLKKKSAITLKDCECIGLKVSETVNGESISIDLDDIFAHSGCPSVIIKDRDRTLQKGVRLYTEKKKMDVEIIDDIGHVIASLMKADYEQSADYKQFTSLTAKGAKSLRQTSLAFLVPPKLRKKGRFQSIGKLGEWGKKVLKTLEFMGPSTHNSAQEKVCSIFAELPKIKSFIIDFANTSQITSEVMKTLKNQGLNPNTQAHCLHLSEKLTEGSKVKTGLQNWLKKHQIIQQQFPSISLPVSSDIIESLFGNFKHVIERSPQADMNRTTLLIPTLCGSHDEVAVIQALRQASHDDLVGWDKENIPYTLRRKRQAFFAGSNIQITGNLCAN